MRKAVTVLLLAVMVVCAVWVTRPELLPWENVTADVDAYAAAQMVRTALEQNPEQTTFRFRDRQLDKSELFRALEATWPYALTLSTTTSPNGMMTAQVQVENAAAQHQAELLAQGVVRQHISPDMPLRERLQTLHDYVVRTCVYDTATAERETLEKGSGADAPFTASGALVGGSAVCAGYSRALMQLCDAAGIDALYIADEKMNHSWNVVRLYDEILYIDTTFDDPVPDRGDHVMTKYFLQDGETLARTHSWDRAFYDSLVEQALPASLGAAQRLFDLGLLPEPPRAAQMKLPPTARVGAFLKERTGVALSPKETFADAATRVWGLLERGALTRQLLADGRFDEVRARQVGLSENAVSGIS